MDDQKLQEAFPGAIHLGTIRAGHKGPGTYLGGVVKLQGNIREDLYSSAVSFLNAADRCLNGNKVETGIEVLVVPGTVCAALACELFLKYILLREGSEPVKRHGLLELFQKCSTESQAALSQISDILGRNTDHFVYGRYHHEQDLFSFRQAELLGAAQALSEFVRSRFFEGAA